MHERERSNSGAVTRISFWQRIQIVKLTGGRDIKHLATARHAEAVLSLRSLFLFHLFFFRPASWLSGVILRHELFSPGG